ncbi:MAG: hypothetical protein HGA37_12850, partial [Lentimicrobium sp.]|nr:hypothetical protein [Lentimicrobium sp.]
RSRDHPGTPEPKTQNETRWSGKARWSGGAETIRELRSRDHPGTLDIG